MGFADEGSVDFFAEHGPFYGGVEQGGGALEMPGVGMVGVGAAGYAEKVLLVEGRVVDRGRVGRSDENGVGR